jgi:phosphotransferase system enzyme I (PtsI)
MAMPTTISRTASEVDPTGGDIAGELPSEHSAMIVGIPASSGIAAGVAVICHCNEPMVVPRRPLMDAGLSHEMERFEAATDAVEAQLRKLAADVRETSGAADAGIFEAQVQMLRDPLLRKEVADRCLRGRINVEAAVSDAAEKLITAFGTIDDPVFRERAADVRDVARRLLGRLLEREEPELGELPEGSIVVARELLPSLAVGLGKKKIRGLIAERGGATAHAVILARSLGIPAVINAAGATTAIRPGDRLIVDGLAGRVFVQPSEAVRRDYEHRALELTMRQSALKELIDRPAVTRDGVEIKLCANAGKGADAIAAAAFRAEGIGLYRTEFVFLLQAQFPTEEQQYRLYREAAELVAPHGMVVRVLDVGSDKLLPYFPLPVEANPSLGRRGTRLLLGHPEILRTQLRAILRLSATHPVSLLFPMIGGLDEFLAARRAVEEVKAQLGAEHLAFNPQIEVGAMIETASAAITARWLAQAVDFLSVGTNDLVQYLLTTDRTSSEMAGYYEPLHPAVIQTLKIVVDAAAAARKPLSVCGEIAGNPACTELLLGLGVTSLSVAPSDLLEIKRVVRSLDLSAARSVAARALAAGTISEVKASLVRAPSAISEDGFQRRALQRWRSEGGAGP